MNVVEFAVHEPSTAWCQDYATPRRQHRQGAGRGGAPGHMMAGDIFTTQTTQSTLKKDSSNANGILESQVRYAAITRRLIEAGEVTAARRLIAVALQQDRVDSECRLLARFLELPKVRVVATRQRPGGGEHLWLVEHGHEYSGRWVAVLENSLIATAADLEQLLQILRERPPAAAPLIHYIDPS